MAAYLRRLLRRREALFAACVVTASAGTGIVSSVIVRSSDNATISRADAAVARSDATATRLRQDEIGLCHRLNVHRVDQDDANWYREWQFDRFFLAAIVHPLRPTKRQSRRQRRETRRAEAYLRSIVNGVTWTPATKTCATPGEGAPTVRFVIRQPSPKELSLGRGQ